MHVLSRPNIWDSIPGWERLLLTTMSRIFLFHLVYSQSITGSIPGIELAAGEGDCLL
jgi:hypothetical protein